MMPLSQRNTEQSGDDIGNVTVGFMVTMNPTVILPMATPPKPMLEHAIRHRAYELYLQRGKAHGHDVDDWLQAEAELVHGHSMSDSNMPRLSKPCLT